MCSWQKCCYLSLLLFIILPIWAARSALAQATAEATPAPPTAELLYPDLTGAFIELTAEPMRPDLWTRLQWQDASGNWHGIEGWQGSFNPDQRVLWYVGAEQLGDGPFRWLVDESQGGERLGMSQPFNLPSRGGEVLRLTVALTPEKMEDAVGSPPAVTPTPSIAASPQNIISQTITIDALAGWIDSGLQVASGGQVEIVYLSSLWTSGGEHALHDANGTAQGYICSLVIPASACVEPVPDAIKGALVARIGDAPPFVVGNETSFRVANQGPLLLSMNDSNLSDDLLDNAGSIVIRISITHPAPDEVAMPEGSYVYDNFDNPAYDGTYNSTLWTRVHGCEDAAQNDGVIAFQSSCDLFAGPASVSVEQLGLFQARVKVASDFQGVAATQEIIFSTELSTGSWWAFCGIIADAEGVKRFFNVVNVGLDEFDLHQTMPAEYDRWYTIRLEVDSRSMTFSCYVDDQLLGSVVPKDAEQLREVHFERVLEAARQPDSFATTYADDVLISLPDSPAEAGTTAPEQLPCGSPYTPDANTLLLLSFDNHYEGVQGEVGNDVGTTFTTGKYGQAVVFDANDRLTLATADNLSLEQGSIEFWLRPNWDGNNEQNYVFFEVGDEWFNRLRLMKDGANNLRFITWDGDTEYGVATHVAHWQAGEWHHIAASWEGTEIALFVDCVEQDRFSPARLPDILADTIHIGAATFEIYKAESVMDELRITNVPFDGDN